MLDDQRDQQRIGPASNRPRTASGRQGVGLANVRDRLRLHYGSDQTFTIEELAHGKVRVTLSLPLQFSERPTMKLAGYGV